MAASEEGRVGFVVTEAAPERIILVKVSEDSQVQKALLEAASRIPERFLITPSQAAGINVKDYIHNNPQVKKHLDNIQSGKLFLPLDMLDMDGFKQFMEDCDLPDRYLWSGFELYRKTGLEKAKQMLVEATKRHSQAHLHPIKSSSRAPVVKMQSIKCISAEPEIQMQSVECTSNDALVKQVAWAKS